MVPGPGVCPQAVGRCCRVPVATKVCVCSGRNGVFTGCGVHRRSVATSVPVVGKADL